MDIKSGIKMNKEMRKYEGLMRDKKDNKYLHFSVETRMAPVYPYKAVTVNDCEYLMR